MSKSVSKVPTAAEVNDAHQCAIECADMAVEHAIRCGQMLIRKKDQLGHGAYGEWVATYCHFSLRTARKYTAAAAASQQNGTAVPFSSLAKLLESAKPATEKPVPAAPKSVPQSNSQKGAVSVVNPKADAPEGTEETATERPAAPATREVNPGGGGTPAGEGPAFEERVPEGYTPEEDDDFLQRVENVMGADDKLSAMLKELKDAHAQVALLKRSRDHYMTVAGEMTRQVKKLAAKLQRLERKAA